MLTLQELIPGTVAIDLSGKIAVIVEHKLNYPKNPVIFTYTAGGTKYKGPVSGFRAVVGSVDLEDFENASEASTIPKRSVGNDTDPFMPDVLKGIKIDEKITIRNGRGLEVVTYKGYNRRRPKYPVSFERNGRPMKGTLSMVVGKASVSA
jgi:hypothetical protein